MRLIDKIVLFTSAGCLMVMFFLLCFMAYQTMERVPQSLLAMQNQINDTQKAIGMNNVPLNR